MKFTLMKRNFLFLALMSFYASCGREDIFDDRRDLVSRTCPQTHPQEIFEGGRDGSNPA